MVTDPIADTLIRIKNAGEAGKAVALVPFSKFRLAVAELLLKHGYIKSITKKGKKVVKNLELEILFDESGNPRIAGVERVSKPSCRVYLPAKDLKSVRRGYGLLAVSTPRGVLSGEDAKKQKLGGEVLFKVW